MPIPTIFNDMFTPLEELENFYLPDELLSPPVCRRCKVLMTYAFGRWVCRVCKVKVEDTLER